jgi:hypothetical protein
MSDPKEVHPAAPAGGGGPGAFKSDGPIGANPAVDKWSAPGVLGVSPVPAGSTLAAANSGAATQGAKQVTDAEIEALDLAETAKKAAYELKKQHPSVGFTSGRRNKAEQAAAMASNVVLNRSWISDTYASSTASQKCQKWVDDNKDKKTVAEITAGLQLVLNGLTDAQLAALSKHLSGEAFDVQPVTEDAEAIKTTIRGLTGLSKFLEKEGGLTRWHAQF